MWTMRKGLFQKERRATDRWQGENRGRDSLLVPAQWILQPDIKSERYETANRINVY